MDIRNFFGKSKDAKSSPTPTNSKPPQKTEQVVIEKAKGDSADSIAPVQTPLEQQAKIEVVENSKSPDISPPSQHPIPSDLHSIINWEIGEPVPYAAVAAAFDKIAATSSRLEKESIFCKLYRSVVVTTPQDLECVVYLTSNVVFPAYEGLELGIGDALLVKAVVDATGRNKKAVEAAYKADGDLGTVACQSRSSQSTLAFGAKPKPLTARFVLEQLRAITKISGTKSMDRKVGIIKKMMVSCQGDEAKYIVRALQGKLRIGTAAQTVLVGLAHAFATPPPPVTSSATNATVVEDRIDTNELKETGLEDSEDEEEESKEKTSKPASRGKKSKRVIEDDEEEEAEHEEDHEAVQDANLDSLKVTDTPPEPSGSQMDVVISESVEKDERKIPTSVPGLEFDSISDENLLEVIDLIPVNPPQEAVKLNTTKKLPKEIRNELAVIAVKRAFSECPSLTHLSNALLQNQSSLHELHKYCKLTPGVPVAPMLAKPTKQVAEVLKRLSGQLFTMEYKYDGERAQIHFLEDGTIKIFSRNSEDNTLKYPEFLDVIRRAKKGPVTSCVVDAEVVAYDRERHCLLPFQILSTRKRKVDENDTEDQKVQVILQAFDLIFLNGKSLLKEPLLFRRTLLHNSFTHLEGYFHFASGMDHLENGDTTAIEIFMQEACNSFCEGLMVKTLNENASYEPSKRSLNWLKLKKDYINGMGVCDSVDLVVIGGYHGRGKRTNVYGAYLMACYDPVNDEYQSVCKVGTGFKDEDLIRLTEQMKGHILGSTSGANSNGSGAGTGSSHSSNKKPSNYNVGDPLTPDDWFDNAVVWELQAADLSKSSVHKGGIDRLGDSGRGIGLRFPRYIRDRPDKKPEMATTSEQIVDMYQSQGDMMEGGSGGGDDDEDDDIL